MIGKVLARTAGRLEILLVAMRERTFVVSISIAERTSATATIKASATMERTLSTKATTSTGRTGMLFFSRFRETEKFTVFRFIDIHDR